MIYKVIEHPSDILRVNCAEVVDFDESLSRLVQDMKDTVHFYSGIGLAAPQIGFAKQVIIVSYDRKLEALINPNIIHQSQEKSTQQEGCLSLPNYYASISRPKKVTIEYYNESGDLKHCCLTGVNSHVAQHEIDHLRGKLIIDY